MGMEDFTRHQQGIIKRYYQNADGLQLQRLSELAGELYLSEGKKRAKTWAAAAALMLKLGVPQARVDLIVAADKPEMVANVVKELQAEK